VQRKNILPALINRAQSGLQRPSGVAGAIEEFAAVEREAIGKLICVRAPGHALAQPNSNAIDAFEPGGYWVRRTSDRNGRGGPWT